MATETFDAVGAGEPFSVPRDANIQYEVTGPFSGTLALQRDTGGGLAFENVLFLSAAGQGTYIVPVTPARYRWAAVVLASGEATVESSPTTPLVPGAVSPDDITGATAVGKSVLTAADAAAARVAMGAGTSSLALGTTSTTAKAGDYAPPAASTSVAGVIQIGTGAANAAAGNHNHAVTADAGSGLAAAANIQALAVALSTRIKTLEDAAA